MVLTAVWVADPDDVVFAKIASHLNFDHDNRLIGIIAKRMLRPQRDVDGMAW